MQQSPKIDFFDTTPIAMISEELYKRLERLGVEFGSDISEESIDENQVKEIKEAVHNFLGLPSEIREEISKLSTLLDSPQKAIDCLNSIAQLLGVETTKNEHLDFEEDEHQYDYQEGYLINSKREAYFSPEVSTDDFDDEEVYGKKAEEFVAEEERKLGFEATVMEDDNPGYDIIASKDGKTRYIEVKSITRAWTQGRRVSITGRQIQEAVDRKEDWWLYVVEKIDTTEPRIYRIPNPILNLKKVALNSAWKRLNKQ